MRPGTVDRLRKREGLVFPGGPRTVAALRIHRAVSWLARTEKAKDGDGRLLFLWIAFNALYGEDHEMDGGKPDWEDRRRFFGRIVACRGASAVHDAMWGDIHARIRRLTGNQYAYYAFWKHRNGVPGFGNWKHRLEGDNSRIQTALRRQDTQALLELLFGRLYVVRNQLLHGGATWAGRLNRTQVEDGAAILGRLTPIFVRLMMDHPSRDWGRPHYAPGPKAQVILDAR